MNINESVRRKNGNRNQVWPVDSKLVIEPAAGTALSGTLSFQGEMMSMGGDENVSLFAVEATFTAAQGAARDLPRMLGSPSG
jgi:hypothetical protein